MDVHNEKRLIASHIIVELYNANQRQQLEILRAQIEAALKQLSDAPGKED